MDTSVKQKRRWLIEFGLASLVPVFLLGLFLSQAIRSHSEDRAIGAAQHKAQLVADLAVQRSFESGVDLSRGLTADEQTELVSALDAVRQGTSVSRTTLRDRAGTVVYSDDPLLATGNSPVPGDARIAGTGDTVSRVDDLSKNPAAADASLGRVLQVFTPVRVGGSSAPISGTMELWLPYSEVAKQVEHETGSLYVLLWIGLVLLWGTVLGVVAAASKRLRRQAAEKEEQALSDGLTGLPNRTMFQTMIERAMTGVGRRKKMGVVMLMDLDRFKDVNDTLGHHNGDLLLQRIGSRLHSVLRDTETVARLGGDEFAILLPEVPDRQSVVPVVRRVLKVLEEPVVVGGLALQCEGSIGLAIFPEHGTTVESVMRAADVAMYMAKENRSGYEFYDARRHEHRHDAGRLALIGELRRAMDETELVLYYQPKIDLETGTATGVEALARWHHPERGLLSPDEFIPLAERSNLLRPMTLYLLDSALRQANAWRTRGLEVSVAVNLSMQNLIDLRLPNDLARLLTSWRLPPGSLELEITESTIMADHRRAMTILSRLNKMGVTLTVDDFGTGYSSLAYLQSLPVSSIKIDKSFVMAMAEDPGNATIVQSTIDLGHNLGLKVVAEGVENAESYNKLASLGCDYAQGYFLSRPLSPDRATVWLDAFMGRTGDGALDEWVVEAPVSSSMDAPAPAEPADAERPDAEPLLEAETP
ncbi:MAG TPA: EAL domain-containing protein [Thermoleophilaceae bacterium]|nr:EAL domain-containing protein [Thermoleophilaceae bacterium]